MSAKRELDSIAKRIGSLLQTEIFIESDQGGSRAFERSERGEDPISPRMQARELLTCLRSYEAGILAGIEARKIAKRKSEQAKLDQVFSNLDQVIEYPKLKRESEARKARKGKA